MKKRLHLQKSTTMRKSCIKNERFDHKTSAWLELKEGLSVQTIPLIFYKLDVRLAHISPRSIN